MNWANRQIRSFLACLVSATAVLYATTAWAAVTIPADATSGMSCANSVCTPTAANPALNVTDLENQLASGNVEVTTMLISASVNMSDLGSEKVLHSFQSGSDGASPYYGALIADGASNAYGTTSSGGSGGCSDGGCGTVYKLTKDRKERVLYSFRGGSDGAGPLGALTRDASGTLYGTTVGGGGTGCGGFGCGTVFEVARDGRETVLYTFQSEDDGFQPVSNVIKDKSGNLYGTTGAGGDYSSSCSSEGCGTVFELQSNGTKIALYKFQGGTDGQGPTGPLIMDFAGDLYGTTQGGGGCALGGCGTVFELTPAGDETILYAFQGGDDGLGPLGGVVMSSGNDLYGTTFSGGAHNCCGVVFKVPAGGGSETTVYSFRGGSDGANPLAGVIFDKKGNLYGTTEYGGSKGCGGRGCGTVFKLAPDGTESVLYAFKGRHQNPHGANPAASLLLGKKGTLYGTTTVGGTANDGVVFSLKTK